MRLKVMRATRQQFTTVQHLFKRGDIGELIVATDAGREGELVARWIWLLGGWKGHVKRLWISSQTDAAIKAGFAALKSSREYDNLYHAAQSRAEADWLIA
jgi:DNA topoisomerase-3